MLFTSFLLINSTASAQSFHFIAIVDNAFQPANLTITEGDSVRWFNQGSAQHTATSGVGCSGDGIWNSGILNHSQDFIFVFSAAGTYPYFCILHCGVGMTGSITVDPGTSIEQVQSNNDLLKIIDAGPNPFNEATTITINLKKSLNVEIELFNLKGKLIMTLLSEIIHAGENFIRIDGRDIEKGVYILRIKSDELQVSKRIIKI
jgi:plastocyanin